MQETAGYRVKIHQALVMPIMLMGAPRQFTILNATVGAAFVLGMRLYYALPVFVVLHVVAVALAKRDPYFFEVIVRNIRKKSYYDV
ncbi:MAG: VirB3 family type IV secretion system protein [Pseudomonadota bacterium]